MIASFVSHGSYSQQFLIESVQQSAGDEVEIDGGVVTHRSMWSPDLELEMPIGQGHIQISQRPKAIQGKTIEVCQTLAA